MPVSRPIKRDEREYDTTSLSIKQHGASLHRDYTAHFFRWNFVRQFVRPTHHVLEIGCGVEQPLRNILFSGVQPRAATYVGVDLNKLPSTNHKRTTLHGEFNFVKRWKELQRSDGYDVIVHLEVFEHMRVDLGRKMLHACYDLLKPGGVMLMSTPCYDGRRHAANHIHEYTVPELQKATEKAGFTVERRWGTFMDIKHIPKAPDLELAVAAAVKVVHRELSGYYDHDALSCFFAPLFPDHARNNLWVCRKEV